MVLTINSYYFPKKLEPVDVCYRDTVFPVRKEMDACILFRSRSGFEGAAVNAVLYWGQLMGLSQHLFCLPLREKLENPYSVIKFTQSHL
jgi:hypothetical protein